MKKTTVVLSLIIFLLLGARVGIFYCKQNSKKNQNLPKKTIQQKEKTKTEDVQVTFPSLSEEVGGIIHITGIAQNWFFEGDFPVRLFDENKKELASAPAVALGDWMSGGKIPFLATIKYPVQKTTKAKIVLQENDPGSDVTGRKPGSMEIPVILQPEKTSVLSYFSNSNVPNDTALCDKTFPVARETSQTMATSREALENLLDGPTEKEKELGYFSPIPEGVKINQFDLSGEIARVDLSGELLNMEAGGVTCEKMLIKTQISETLKQFAPTKRIEITVDGKTNQLETKDPTPGQKN